MYKSSCSSNKHVRIANRKARDGVWFGYADTETEGEFLDPNGNPMRAQEWTETNKDSFNNINEQDYMTVQKVSHVKWLLNDRGYDDRHYCVCQKGWFEENSWNFACYFWASAL